MYYDPQRALVLVVLDVAEGATLKRINTPCGVVIAPASHAQVILSQDDLKDMVYDAAYGQLPDGTIVVGVKNDSGTFPEDEMSLKVRVVLDPYQSKCAGPEVVDPKLVAWGGGCPVCGDLTPDDFGASPDEDDDFDEGSDGDDPSGDDEDESWANDDEDDEDDEAPGEYPMPRRFTLDMLKPSTN
jgi:hypothetical protein